MMLWRTFGHDKAVRVVHRSLAAGRLSHAYVLSGPSNVGKMTLATDMALAVNCLEDTKPCGRCSQCDRMIRGLHSDVRTVGVRTGESDDGRRNRVAIGIEQVREVQREASLKPYEGNYRVFIFDSAEEMSEEAANSLLKTLEEPPNQVIILLLTIDHRLLLPTIISRCQLLELRPVPAPTVAKAIRDGYGLDEGAVLEIARLSDGRPGWAIRAAMNPGLVQDLSDKLEVIERVVEGRFSYASDLASSFQRNREMMRQELRLWLSWWRDILLVKQGVGEYVTNLSRMEKLEAMASAVSSAQVADAINKIREVSEHLESNINSRLALENMMLAVPGP